MGGSWLQDHLLFKFQAGVFYPRALIHTTTPANCCTKGGTSEWDSGGGGRKSNCCPGRNLCDKLPSVHYLSLLIILYLQCWKYLKVVIHMRFYFRWHVNTVGTKLTALILRHQWYMLSFNSLRVAIEIILMSWGYKPLADYELWNTKQQTASFVLLLLCGNSPLSLSI